MQTSNAWYVSKAPASTLEKKRANVCTPMTQFLADFPSSDSCLGCILYLGIFTREYNRIKTDLKQRLPNVAHPWVNNTETSGRVKLNKQKPIFCAVGIIKFGNLLACYMLRTITSGLKLSLAHPAQMARMAQEVFELNHAWVFAQLNMPTVSTSEYCEKTSNRTRVTH